MDKLELLNLSKNFCVTKKDKTQWSDSGYEVETMNSNLGAFISDDKKITYYVTGCYDSGSDWIDFDIDELTKLKKFCELMIK